MSDLNLDSHSIAILAQEIACAIENGMKNAADENTTRIVEAIKEAVLSVRNAILKGQL